LEKEKILVTGGAGYIGAQNLKLLKKNSFSPITFDNLSTGNLSSVKWGDFIKGDLKNLTDIDNALKKYKPKAVMHFAANALVYESTQNPQKYYENNVIGTINLLKAMLENNIKYFIFSSSCATYGHPEFSPITEDHPQIPISPYGKSKYMIEEILKDYSNVYGLRYVTLRYFNAAGADLELEIGENRTEETHLIPLAIDTSLGINPFLNIYGTDYDTLDGTAIRDYIHVEDLASAHLKALNYIFEGKNSIELNLGSEKGFSVLEIVKEIEKLTQKKINLKYVKRRKADPSILFADSSKAKKVLKWYPEVSDIQTIITSALKWHQKKKNLKS